MPASQSHLRPWEGDEATNSGNQIHEKKRLPRKVVEYPPMDIFKIQLDTVLGNLFQLTLFEKESWTRRSPEGPSNLNSSVILRRQ